MKFPEWLFRFCYPEYFEVLFAGYGFAVPAFVFFARSLIESAGACRISMKGLSTCR
jgi:hypothetical protein